LRFWSRRAARPPARPPWRRRVAPAASRRAHRPPSTRRQRGDAPPRRHQTRPPRHGAPRRGGGRSAGPLAPTHRRRPPRVPPPTGPASARGTLWGTGPVLAFSLLGWTPSFRTYGRSGEKTNGAAVAPSAAVALAANLVLGQPLVADVLVEPTSGAPRQPSTEKASGKQDPGKNKHARVAF